MPSASASAIADAGDARTERVDPAVAKLGECESSGGRWDDAQSACIKQSAAALAASKERCERRHFTWSAASKDDRAKCVYPDIDVKQVVWPTKCVATTPTKQPDKTLETFYTAMANQPSKVVVRSAFELSRRKAAAQDAAVSVWQQRTIDAWERLRSSDAMRADAMKPEYADCAAEAEYGLTLDTILTHFTSSELKAALSGDTETVRLSYATMYEKADRGSQRLKRIEGVYAASDPWRIAGLIERAWVIDLLATSLDNASFNLPKMLKLANGRTINLHQFIEQLEANQQFDQADALRDVARTQWRAFKDTELDVLRKRIMTSYVHAVYVAKQASFENEWVKEARTRLAFYEDYLGDENFAKYSAVTITDEKGSSKTISFEEWMATL